MKIVRSAVLGMLVAACGVVYAAAAEEKRVALVIGNSEYQTVNRLTNPANDASAAASLFQSAGFKVFLRRDLGNVEFRRTIREFHLAARGADMAVIYFAGHGLEIKGANYLVPVDAKLANDLDALDEAIPLDRMLDAVENVKKLRLVILDACRDNPFEKRMTRNFSSRAVTRGLAEIGAPSNMLVSYAAKAGSTADDGTDEHSPFTTAMLKHLATPGLEIRIAMGKIRDEVIQQTGNRQEPFTYGSLGGDELYLFPKARPAFTGGQPNSADALAAYEFASRVNSKEGWEAFLAHHAGGFHAELARIQLAKLSTPASASTTTSQSNTDENREWERVRFTDDPAALRSFMRIFPNSPKTLDAQSRLELLLRAAAERASARAKNTEAAQQKSRKQDAKQESVRKQAAKVAPKKQRAIDTAEKGDQSTQGGKRSLRQADAPSSERRRTNVNREAAAAGRLERPRRAALREPAPQPAPMSGPPLGGFGGMLGLFGLFGGR